MRGARPGGPEQRRLEDVAVHREAGGVGRAVRSARDRDAVVVDRIPAINTNWESHGLCVLGPS